MDHTEVVLEGTLNADGSLLLDEKPDLPAGRVQVVLKSVSPPSDEKSLLDVVRAIWEGQRRRGHVPPTREEVDRELEQIRTEWDDHSSALESLQTGDKPLEQP